MSIRFRLTLWYSLILALTLLLFSSAVYLVVQRSLQRQVELEIRNKAREVTRSVRVQPLPLRLQRIVLPDVDVFASPNTFLQIIDLDGEVIARSSNLGNQIIPVEGKVLELAANGQPVYQTLRAGRQALKVYNQPLVAGNRVLGVIQVGRSMQQTLADLGRLRWALILASIMTILLASGLGYFLAQAALRPIGRLTKAVEAISTAHDLERQVEYQGPRDELGRLAETFNEMLARLAALYQQLEETSAAHKRFLADASHELRTPLTIIQGNLDFLQQARNAPPVEKEEAMSDSISEVKRMGRLVSNLLDLARADAGRHLEKAPVNLGELLQEVARQGQRMAGAVYFFTTRLEDLEGEIFLGEADRLKELLLILLENAFKYTAPGGKVSLENCSTNKQWGIAVSDTGSGISPEDLPHIFERFYRADHSRQRGGTGLGLAIATWIAGEHGGRLTVTSQLGEGSIFTLWLPKAFQKI